MSSLLFRRCRPRRFNINPNLSRTSVRYSHRIKPKLDPHYVFPGQQIHPDLVPLLRNLVSPFTSAALPHTHIWKILFTAKQPRDPVSTTNLKAFSEHCQDLLARDTAIVCLVPGQDPPIKWWLSDIVRSMDNPDLELDLLTETRKGASSRILGFPVISDQHYSIHQRLGFKGPRDGLPKWAPPVEYKAPDHHLLHVIGPDNIVRFTQVLPTHIGFNVLEIVRTVHALQTAEDYDILIPADWTPGRDALMPVDRKRQKKGIEALKRDVESQSAPATPLITNPDDPEDDGKALRDRDEDGEIEINETNIEQILDEHKRKLDEEQAAQEEDQDERIPPGEVWQVLPYLKYVRIDDSVDNTASVIGYENMRTDLLRSFERFKVEKDEKNKEEKERLRQMQRKQDMRRLGALSGMTNTRGW
ncbi:hypothetical protein Dda_8930 [Drechslerella dactyloides]|uniref:Uncharacterized protein n=1 Tax=Drechslerella dactyloides TaxID=74499 RepID=A0AAD6IRB1_DREDA|nr:hypothetical protein Dda_8930 [Drechslerella dactyloides]